MSVRSWALRDIFRGRHAPGADPHGLRLRGARISGRLDLENITGSLWLELYDCLIDDGINVRDATLTGLVLKRCLLEHLSRPALDATRLNATHLDLNRSTVIASSTIAAIQLTGAQLDTLACVGTSLRNNAGSAVRADGLRVERSRRSRTGEGPGPAGTSGGTFGRVGVASGSDRVPFVRKGLWWTEAAVSWSLRRAVRRVRARTRRS